MIEAIRTQANRVDTVNIILFIVSVTPFVAGWLAGFVVRCGVWMAAAVVAGYKAGRGSA